MTRLEWDTIPDRKIKYGVEKGVLYPKNSPGVVWNGLISVDESESDSDVVVGYFDGQAYYRERSSSSFSAKLTSFTHPTELYATEPFGLSYVTGNELHIVYNAMVSTKDHLYQSTNDNPDPSIFTWNLVTRPVKISGMKATAHIIIDLDRMYSEVSTELTSILYGTESTDARIPSIDELLVIFEEGSLLLIIDHGDGTWTAIGPDNMVDLVDSDSFEIDSPSVIFINDHTYTVSSW